MKLFRLLTIVLLLGIKTLYADTLKVVYDLSSGDSNKIEKHLLDSLGAVSRYYSAEKKKLKVRVVISGDAYKYFIDDLKASPYASDKEAVDIQAYFKIRLRDLHDVHGVTFQMCSSGMKARKIEKHTLYNYVEAEKMKSVYLIDAQNEGYAYMPIY
jgi:intracellular sulfur oxidation DsrE/DsrF family protein